MFNKPQGIEVTDSEVPNSLKAELDWSRRNVFVSKLCPKTFKNINIRFYFLFS